jgi:hypothetical protein
MALDEFTFQEVLQSTIVSLSPETWDFKLRRTLPIAIYVDAGEEQSVEIGERIATEVQEVLREFGYEELQEIGRYYGSLILLNLSRSPEPEDGPTFSKKLAGMRDALSKRLRNLPWKQTAKIVGGTVTVAVAIGTVVTLVSAAPAGIAIGAFAVPPLLWTSLLVGKEGKDVIEAAKDIFTESKAARKALAGEQSGQPERSPAELERRVKELEDEMRQLREGRDPPKLP